MQGNRGDVWFAQIAGAALAQRQLYVFDPEAARVLVFDEGLTSATGSFGAEGEGPGEFRAVTYAGDGVARWIMPAGADELVIFDGYRLQRFGADGRYVGMPMAIAYAAGLTPNTPQFGWANDSLYYFVGSFDPIWGALSESGESRTGFFGKVEADGQVRDLLTMSLPDVPKDRRGVKTTGPRQARPSWAMGPKCLWASDGSRPVFYRVRRDGSGRDSVVLDLALPDPFPEEDEGAASLLQQMGASGSLPEPTALWRIRDLLFDPAGRLWMRRNPEQSSDTTIAVVVLDPESGETVGFQVPVFPLAFGAPGVFYAATQDSIGQPLIGRFVVTPTATSSSTSSHPSRPGGVPDAGDAVDGRPVAPTLQHPWEDIR